MKLQFLFCIAAAVLVAVCGEEEPNEGARLLVHKNIHNKYLVEDKDLIIKVNDVPNRWYNISVL